MYAQFVEHSKIFNIVVICCCINHALFLVGCTQVAEIIVCKILEYSLSRIHYATKKTADPCMYAQ